MNIEVWSDGSATTKENCGGWGVVIVIDGVVHKELSGYLEKATNNDAELTASLKGLEFVYDNLYTFTLTEYPPIVTLISDSEIILNWSNGTYKFKQQQKIESYNRLRFLVDKMNVQTKWVKGHSGNIHNERCDKLANNARKGITANGIDNKGTNVDTRIGLKKTGIVSLWYLGKLKVIDLENHIIEDFNKEVHGKRGSVIEIREGRDR